MAALTEADVTLVGTTVNDNVDRTIYTSGTATPGANRKLLAAVVHRPVTAGGPGPDTISGWGLTWTLVHEIISGTIVRINVYEAATGGSPSSGAFTADFGADTQEGCNIIVVQIAGTPDLGAVAQKAEAASNGATSLAVALTNAPASGSLTLGFYGTNQNSAITPGTGFATVSAGNHGTTAQAAIVEVDDGNGSAPLQTANITTASARIVGVAVEVAEAVAGNVTVTPGTATLTLSTFAPTVLAPRLVTPGTRALALTTFAPTILLPKLATPGKVSLVLATFAPTVAATAHQRVVPATVALALSMFAPSVLTPRLVTPATAALVLSMFAPTVTGGSGGGATVTPGTATLALTTFAPTVYTPRLVTPATLALALATFAPTILAPRLVTIGKLSLVTATFAPTVTVADDKVATPLPATLALTRFEPVVSITADMIVIPQPVQLVIVTYAPLVIITSTEARARNKRRLLASDPQLRHLGRKSRENFHVL